MFLLTVLFVLICQVIGENTENQVGFSIFIYICMVNVRTIFLWNRLRQPVPSLWFTANQELVETEDATIHIPLATKGLFVIFIGITAAKVWMETEDVTIHIPLATKGLFVMLVRCTAVKLKDAKDLDLLFYESDC